MTNQELLAAIDKLKALMISVATGGPRIGAVEGEFIETYDAAAGEFARRGISNPLPYRDLWQWYGRWTEGDLPKYQQRREHVAALFRDATRLVQNNHAPVEPTGWPKVDRTIAETKTRLAAARNEEQFQAIGLLCREALISVAQAVFDAAKHPILDGKEASTTDAKRMLEAYVAVELAGATNDEIRKYARAAFDLSNQLQHRRTATFRHTALCVEATASVVSLIAIVAGIRDPEER